MTIDPILREIAQRFERIRCGLDIGFNDEMISAELRNFRGGVWMSIDAREEYPFDDAQFEVVVLNGLFATREIIREAHRVLKPEGCLFFTVPERVGKQEGFTVPAIYRMIREGFDILAVSRPKWWFFRRQNRTLTVCARKKAWREHKGFMRECSLPFTPFRSRK